MSKQLVPLLFLAFSSYFAWELRKALRDKVTFFGGLFGEREWSPLVYWFGVSLNVAFLGICLAGAIGSAFRELAD